MALTRQPQHGTAPVQVVIRGSNGEMRGIVTGRCGAAIRTVTGAGATPDGAVCDRFDCAGVVCLAGPLCQAHRGSVTKRKLSTAVSSPNGFGFSGRLDDNNYTAFGTARVSLQFSEAVSDGALPRNRHFENTSTCHAFNPIDF